MIVVTTPTGHIGQHVVRSLLDSGEPLRLIARDPAKLPSAVLDRVEVVAGSHGDAETIDRALNGADAIFWLCPPTPVATPAAATVEFTQPGAEAIARHGLRHVVVVTNLGRDTAWQDRAGMVTASIAMVDLLRTTGAAVRGLALPALMDNALQQVEAIRQGRMFGPIDPDKSLPHVASADVGEAATQFLADRSWEGQEDVPVVGPKNYSYRELAAIISEVLGTEVRYQQIALDVLKEQFVAHGMAEAFAQGMIDMFQAKNEGMDNVAPPVSGFIGQTSFQQWARERLN